MGWGICLIACRFIHHLFWGWSYFLRLRSIRSICLYDRLRTGMWLLLILISSWWKDLRLQIWVYLWDCSWEELMSLHSKLFRIGFTILFILIPLVFWDLSDFLPLLHPLLGESVFSRQLSYSWLFFRAAIAVSRAPLCGWKVPKLSSPKFPPSISASLP